jgi:hypothetical protein
VAQAPEPTDRAATSDDADAGRFQESHQFARLSGKAAARTPEEARERAREWTVLATRPVDPALADLARVRAIEALELAWRLSGGESDREAARRAVRAYLLREDAGRKQRVRAVAQELER